MMREFVFKERDGSNFCENLSALAYHMGSYVYKQIKRKEEKVRRRVKASLYNYNKLLFK